MSRKGSAGVRIPAQMPPAEAATVTHPPMCPCRTCRRRRAAEVRRQALRGDPPTDGPNPGDAPALYRLARTHSTARTTSQKTSVLTAPHLLRLACHQIAAPNTTRTRTTPTPPSSLMPQEHASLLGPGTGSMLSRKTQRKRNGLPCPACGGAQRCAECPYLCSIIGRNTIRSVIDCGLACHRWEPCRYHACPAVRPSGEWPSGVSSRQVATHELS